MVLVNNSVHFVKQIWCHGYGALLCRSFLEVFAVGAHSHDALHATDLANEDCAPPIG